MLCLIIIAVQLSGINAFLILYCRKEYKVLQLMYFSTKGEKINDNTNTYVHF